MKKTKIFKDIPLIDIGLMIIMLLLLIQSAINIFLLKPTAAADMTNLDVIFRTTFAGIFGYFLSENFVRKNSSSDKEMDTPISQAINLNDSVVEELMPSSMIGFRDSEANTSLEVPTASYQNNIDEINSNNTQRRTIQVIISIAVSVYCLVLLILIRNFWTVDSTMIPTLAQLRDVLSGCVGFLLGMPSGSTKS